MKKVIYGAIFGLIFAIIIVVAGAYSKGAPSVSYVYSGSMEPIIQINDGFIIWPTNNIKIGDIITYRPLKLKANYITHRIIGIENGEFITKGDNSPYSDMDSGEPLVSYDRIIGKVMSINGNPLIIPKLGFLVKGISSVLGNKVNILSTTLIVIAILSAIMETRRNRLRKKPRHRMRLGEVYRIVVSSTIVIMIIIMLLSSRVTQFDYLVSTNPGTLGNQVKVHEAGELKLTINNKGLLPVWTIARGITPLNAEEEAIFMLPFDKQNIEINVEPQSEIGIKKGYIQLYTYPAFVPGNLIIYLYSLDPNLTVIINGIAAGFWMWLILKIIARIPGFEAWIPVKALKDKITERRLNRLKLKLFNRRRA